ncbi:DUF2306 domain-containing protein [Chitinophaga eiseniae]|uniref:DUF2306 domain-containing protein n=1 Tax=Chitinophaga eiseniae TaxID=634771 RepID=A0A847SAL6_9BACT|nr:DUF2306 domain-containing protein [Chitinophaga eiseniae]NLR78861.1 DUF2306 domain-containing protein [Chitinophaga eiseniae]
MQTLFRKAGWLLTAMVILYGTWLMLLLTIPYAAFEKYTDFLITKQRVYPIRHWRISFYVHVFVSITVLLTGLAQFSKYLLDRFPRLHHFSGKIYVMVVIALSGPTGLVMGWYANGGKYARISFVLLAILWIVFTIMGWIRAVQRRWPEHLTWMLRSYALTLSALTLRLYTLLLGLMHMPLRPVTAYITVSWLSWTLNLLVAEFVIKRMLMKKMGITAASRKETPQLSKLN